MISGARAVLSSLPCTARIQTHLFVFAVLKLEPRALCTLGDRFTTELFLQPYLPRVFLLLGPVLPGLDALPLGYTCLLELCVCLFGSP